MKVVVNPNRIKISDNNENSLTVIKQNDNFLFESVLNDVKVNGKIFTLQTTIKKILTNPKNTKDSYKVRFKKIGDVLNTLSNPNFLTFQNSLEKNFLN